MSNSLLRAAMVLSLAGVTWPVSMPLLPGATKITFVVRDLNTGHVGSLAVPLK